MYLSSKHGLLNVQAGLLDERWDLEACIRVLLENLVKWDTKNACRHSKQR